MRILKKFIPFFGVLIVFLFFWWICTNTLDPDLGWHLRMGEIISKSGIPKTDPFSYTMPSYPFVDHEWLSNILMYWVYQFGGMSLLAGVYALLLTLIPLCIFGKGAWKKALISIILLYTVMVSRAGIRPQIESWLFFGVLVGSLWKPELWRRIRWTIPVLLLVWVNMHGSFALGIGVLALYVFGRALQERKIDWANVCVFLLSFLSTFITPYGWRSWWEVYMQMTDPNLHVYIMEWWPFYTIIDLGFITTLGFVVGLNRCFPNQKILYWKFLVFIALLAAALMALRHMPFFVIISGFLIIDYVVVFYQHAEKTAWGRRYVNRIYLLFVGAALGAFLTTAIITGKGMSGAHTQDVFPVKAVNFIKGHAVEGNIFNDYSWGGYLIWKLPSKKVFIDGRMPSFRWEGTEGESRWVFQDYRKLMLGEEVFQLFKKYSIHYVMVPNPWNQKTPDRITLFMTRLGFIPSRVRSTVLLSYLTQRGWRVFYQDSTTIIVSDRNK